MSGIKYNSGVSNYVGTPFAISNTFANLGNYLPNIVGSLYFAIDGTTETILQADGTNWVSLAGTGGGGVGTLQQVTTLGASSNQVLTLTPSTGIFIQDDLGFYSLGKGNLIGDMAGLNIEINPLNGFGVYKLGNFLGVSNETQLNIDSANEIIFLSSNGNGTYGLKLNFVNQLYQFGDFLYNNSYLECDADGGTGVLYSNNLSILQASSCRLKITNTNLISQYNANEIGLFLNLDNRQFYIGDFNSYFNNTTLIVDDNAQIIQTTFSNGIIGLKLDETTGEYGIGDFYGIYNNESIIVKPLSGEIFTRGGLGNFGLYINQNTFVSTLGDYFNNNFNTWINVDDNIQKITFNAAIGKYQFNNVRTYPNNPAAIAAGLAVGTIYKNGITGILSIVF